MPRCRNMFVAAHDTNLFRVKLGDGSILGPQAEDVHWLDFSQLQVNYILAELGTFGVLKFFQ